MDQINIPLDMKLLEDGFEIKELPAYKNLNNLIKNFTYCNEDGSLEPLQEIFIKLLFRFGSYDSVGWIVAHENNWRKTIAIINESAFGWCRKYLRGEQQSEALEFVDDIVNEFMKLITECFIYYQLRD